MSVVEILRPVGQADADGILRARDVAFVLRVVLAAEKQPGRHLLVVFLMLVGSFLAALRVDVVIPPLSIYSSVGSMEAVIAHPPDRTASLPGYTPSAA